MPVCVCVSSAFALHDTQTGIGASCYIIEALQQEVAMLAWYLHSPCKCKKRRADTSITIQHADKNTSSIEARRCSSLVKDTSCLQGVPEEGRAQG